MNVTANIKSRTISAEVHRAVIEGGGTPYEGSYEVTPHYYGQRLETAQKTLSRDVTVHPIEISRTTNPAGGKTVYIGVEE